MTHERPRAGLVIYSRPGCHLCDDARAVLDRAGAAYDEVDITTDDELHARYVERIPVVTFDGAEVFEFFVDETVLHGLLDKVARR